MQRNLREFYIEANLKYVLLSFFLFGTMTLFSILIPQSALLTYATMLFTVGILLVTLAFDPLAWMPFAVTHTEFANGIAIPMAIVSARLVMESTFAIPGTLMIAALTVWWASIILHFFSSESIVFSYLGGIERQMGMTFRFTVPVILFTGWQIFHFAGTKTFFGILLAAAMIETVVLTLQFLDEEHHVKFPWTFTKSIGFRRYVGTISNPIPVANFLVTLLPVALAFYTPDSGFIFFVVSYLAISWGLFLSNGRGSYISSAFISLLETVYVLFAQRPLYMTLIAVAVILVPPIAYLFTPQGKSNYDRMKLLFDFIGRKFKSSKKKGDEAQGSSESKPESGAVNRAFVWKEAIRAYKKRPFTGYGISNIGRAMRKVFSRKSSSYFMTQVVDRSHNHYLDLLMEGGITHLVIYLALLGVTVYSSVTTGMWWIVFALVAYSLDLVFSFPLQINYLTVMLLISVAGGTQFVNFSPISYAFFGLAGLYFVSLYFAHTDNTAMRYVQLAHSAQNQGDVKIALDSALSALKTAPFEQRYFTVSSNILDTVSSTGKLKLDDLHTFRVWFNASKNFITKTSEAPDIPFATMGMVYALVFASTRETSYANECWSLLKTALKVNPHFIMTRRALFVLLNSLAGINEEKKNMDQAVLLFTQAEAVLRGIIDDFLNAPGANYELENSYWQAYFDILKKIGKEEERKRYFGIYKNRFKAAIFTYDVFTKISKVFNTPVGWTIIDTNGSRFLNPVSTAIGPLIKRIWKFSHFSNELYLTVGQDVQISEDAIRPFMEEFINQKGEDWNFGGHWKDEGYMG